MSRYISVFLSPANSRLRGIGDTIADSPGAALTAVVTILGVIPFVDSENYCGAWGKLW